MPPRIEIWCELFAIPPASLPKFFELFLHRVRVEGREIKIAPHEDGNGCPLVDRYGWLNVDLRLQSLLGNLSKVLNRKGCALQCKIAARYAAICRSCNCYALARMIRVGY